MGASEADEHVPFIDYENLPAPTEGILVTQFITVRSVARSRAFYSEVVGGKVVLEENPGIVKLANSWVLMNPCGPPTPDKPDISVVNYESGNTVSSFLNLRVADSQACYEEWSAKGGEFVAHHVCRSSASTAVDRLPGSSVWGRVRAGGCTPDPGGALRMQRGSSRSRGQESPISTTVTA